MGQCSAPAAARDCSPPSQCRFSGRDCLRLRQGFGGHVRAVPNFDFSQPGGRPVPRRRRNHPSILPIFHPSNLPSFHLSNLPSFQSSILPSFHPSILPVFHPFPPPLLPFHVFIGNSLDRSHSIMRVLIFGK